MLHGTADHSAAGLRRLDRLIWALVAAAAGLVLMAAAFGGFSLAAKSFVAPGATCLLLLGGARFYTRHRSDPRLASALESTAQVIAFAAAAAPLSYVAAACAGALPLQDAAFDAVDKALRFDWKSLFGLMAHAPDLHAVMRVAYLSLTMQMTAVVLLLGLTGRLAWLRVYTLAFLIAAFVTIAISALLPAEGVFLHYGFDPARAAMVPASHTSWPVFFGLRDGSTRLLTGTGAEGIITFPSLHAALAVIMIVALWPVPFARWAGVALNATMLAATPVEGSHYFVDVIAGIAIAIASLYVARSFALRFNVYSAPAKRAGAPVPASLTG